MLQTEQRIILQGPKSLVLPVKRCLFQEGCSEWFSSSTPPIHPQETPPDLAKKEKTKSLANETTASLPATKKEENGNIANEKEMGSVLAQSTGTGALPSRMVHRKKSRQL
jgi:hypothetical protein